MKNFTVKPNAPNVVSEDFEGEVILVNLVNGNYYSLRNSGAQIWKLVEQQRSFEDLQGDLSKMYSVENVSEDLQKFIDQLNEQKLITVNELNGYQTSSIEVNSFSSDQYEAPILEVYSDMQDLLLLDPIHDVDEESGWPQKPDDES